MFVDDIKLAGKKQNICPTWKIRMKDVNLGEPTSFLDHVYLGRTQRECQISKDIVDSYRSMFETRISVGAMENLSEIKASGKPETNTLSSLSSRSCKEMRGNNIANLRIKKLSNCIKSQRHAWVTIILKKTMDLLENYQLCVHKLF